MPPWKSTPLPDYASRNLRKRAEQIVAIAAGTPHVKKVLRRKAEDLLRAAAELEDRERPSPPNGEGHASVSQRDLSKEGDR